MLTVKFYCKIVATTPVLMGFNSAQLAKVPLLRWNRRATFVLAMSH
jgi:hypothetical protein